MNTNGVLKWLPILGLILLMAGAWFTVRMQAVQALPREEAYKTFVTHEDLGEFKTDMKSRLGRIENKLDRLIERR